MSVGTDDGLRTTDTRANARARLARNWSPVERMWKGFSQVGGEERPTEVSRRVRSAVVGGRWSVVGGRGRSRQSMMARLVGQVKVSIRFGPKRWRASVD